MIVTYSYTLITGDKCEGKSKITGDMTDEQIVDYIKRGDVKIKSVTVIFKQQKGN